LVEITAFIRGGIDCGFNRTAQARLDATAVYNIQSLARIFLVIAPLATC